MTLNQGRPFLMLHQPYQRRADLLRVGAALAASGEGAGLLVSYDNARQSGVDEDAGKAGSLTPILGDAGWRFNREPDGQVARASWLAGREPSDTSSWDKAVSEAATAQRALGLDADHDAGAGDPRRPRTKRTAEARSRRPDADSVTGLRVTHLGSLV